MMNFYLIADFLDQCGLLTDENLQHGFTPMTRIRILIKAGFWEESWGPVVSIAGSRAGADFGYQPFEEDDILDLGNLLKRLRDPAPAPAFAFLWNKFTNHEKEKLSKFRESPGESEMKYSPLEITRDEVKRIIIARLNEVMDGTNFHTPALFEDVTIRWRTEDLLQLNRELAVSVRNGKKSLRVVRSRPSAIVLEGAGQPDKAIGGCRFVW